MEYKDLRDLALLAMGAEKNAAVAYSFGDEQYSTDELNDALRVEFNKLACDYATYRENKNLIFRLIEETIDEVLPKKVEQMYMEFADVKSVPQGDKVYFNMRITESSKRRAKTFVTKVGLAGRYEVFKLDGKQIHVAMNAIGGAARLEFEEFLDGRWQFSDFTDIIIEGMNEYIYKEIAAALERLVAQLPTPNKATIAGFDERVMDELLAISDAYAHSTIYCTFEFAAKMLPHNSDWMSEDMKNQLWREGWLGNYKGHKVIVLPQSLVDETNLKKVVDPSYAYIIPTGSDKPIKLAFEGQTAVREIENNDDWSRDLQTYKKFGIAILANHWICAYKNTALDKDTRHTFS